VRALCDAAKKLERRTSVPLSLRRSQRRLIDVPSGTTPAVIECKASTSCIATNRETQASLATSVGGMLGTPPLGVAACRARTETRVTRGRGYGETTGKRTGKTEFLLAAGRPAFAGGGKQSREGCVDGFTVVYIIMTASHVTSRHIFCLR
jgi:hypothetical protein